MARTFKDDFKDPFTGGYEFDHKQLQRFKSMNIPNRSRKAYIFLGHDPCTGCLNFLHHLQTCSGIEILVKPLPIVKEWNRPNKRYNDSRADNQQCLTGSDSDDDDDDDDEEDNH